MTPAPSLPWRRGEWRALVADSIDSCEELLAAVGLSRAPDDEQKAADRAAGQFPPRVPRGLVARMRASTARSALLAQVLPVAAETRPTPGFTADPLGETDILAPSGMLQKYRGRAVLLLTSSCAIHCRYCFRRHLSARDPGATSTRWRDAVAAVASDRSLREVILSGGDPLMLPDRRLAHLVDLLARAPHLRTLRIHSRLPVIIPERVDDDLLGWLGAVPLRRVMVVHANHAAEVSDRLAPAVRALQQIGVAVLNQAVLLRGVNDSTAAQRELSEALFDAGVLPYYLHMLDPVAGAAHFEVGEPEARAIMREVAGRLPGYLVPRLVREREGATSKVPLSWI